MMNTQAFVLLMVLGTAMAAPQGNRRPIQRPSSSTLQQQQQSPQDKPQEQQFTSRFNPEENANQNYFQQQPAAQTRTGNSNSYRESTTFIPIIRFDKQQTVDGGYKTLWETGNNILAEETGVLKKFNGDKESTDAVVQQGSYTYTSPEGQTITVQYTADENGFRATGDHLPTPPPIPADIQKSLDTIYAGIAQQQRQGSQQYQQDNEEQYNQPQQQQFNNNPQGNINFRPTGNRNNNFRG